MTPGNDLIVIFSKGPKRCHFCANGHLKGKRERGRERHTEREKQGERL